MDSRVYTNVRRALFLGAAVLAACGGSSLNATSAARTPTRVYSFEIHDSGQIIGCVNVNVGDRSDAMFISRFGDFVEITGGGEIDGSWHDNNCGSQVRRGRFVNGPSSLYKNKALCTGDVHVEGAVYPSLYTFYVVDDQHRAACEAAGLKYVAFKSPIGNGEDLAWPPRPAPDDSAASGAEGSSDPLLQAVEASMAPAASFGAAYEMMTAQAGQPATKRAMVVVVKGAMQRIEFIDAR